MFDELTKVDGSAVDDVSDRDGANDTVFSYNTVSFDQISRASASITKEAADIASKPRSGVVAPSQKYTGCANIRQQISIVRVTGPLTDMWFPPSDLTVLPLSGNSCPGQRRFKKSLEIIVTSAPVSSNMGTRTPSMVTGTHGDRTKSVVSAIREWVAIRYVIVYRRAVGAIQKVYNRLVSLYGQRNSLCLYRGTGYT